VISTQDHRTVGVAERVSPLADFHCTFPSWLSQRRPLNAPATTGTIHSLGLVFVVLLAAGLRFYDLDRTSLCFDEAVSWHQANLPFLEMIAATAEDNHPPLYNIILHVMIALFGDGETALRAPSVLLGVANVYVLYRLGSALWDRTTGLIAALLLTLSGFHVWYSTEARMYALLAFTATLFVLTVVYATRRPNWPTLTGCAAAGTALLYSHVYGSFVFAGVNIVVLTALVLHSHWFAVDWKKWVAAQAIPVFLFLPWALILWGRAQVVMEGFWVPEPTARFLLKQASHLAGGRLSLGILSTLAGLSLINLGTFSPRSWQMESTAPTMANPQLRSDWQIAILLGWLIVPISSVYLISVFSQPILLDRYLICVLPAFLLLAARGVRTFSFSLPTTASILGIAVLAAILNLPFSTFAKKPGIDYRQAARELSIRYLPSDRIIFSIPQAIVPFQYYFRRPLADSRGCKNVSEISSTDLNIDRFWFVFTHVDTASEWIPIAERTHLMTYSLVVPGLKMFLFERRNIGHQAGGPAVISYPPTGGSKADAELYGYDCSGRHLISLLAPVEPYVAHCPNSGCRVELQLVGGWK
jgi:mannosyltransferase